MPAPDWYIGTNAAVIADELPVIDPDVNRSDWLAVGGALLYELGPEVGFVWWDAWSSDGEKYNRREMHTQWRSIRKSAHKYNHSINTIHRVYDEATLTDEVRSAVAMIEANVNAVVTAYYEK